MLETGIEIKCSNCCWLCGEEGVSSSMMKIKKYVHEDWYCGKWSKKKWED